MIATDTMSLWLDLVRAAWLADIPCAEVMAKADGEMGRTLALHEYAKLGWAEWRKK